VARARNDPNAFMEYVFGLAQDECHRRWQAAWCSKPETVLHGSVGIGKSVQARGHTLWCWGHDPNHRFLYLSATQRHPKRQLRSLRSTIETSTRYRHVFPHIRPGKLWTATEIEIDRDTIEADSSMQVFGAYTESILGSRADTLIIDDLCNFNNTLTESGREKMIEWLASVTSRLTNRGVRVIVLGNWWHKNDATMHLVRKAGFFHMRDPAFTLGPNGEMIPTAPSALAIPEIIRLQRQLGPLRSEAMLMCRSPAAELGRFKSKDFDLALEQGRGLQFRPAVIMHGAPCFTGVDLGHKKKLGSDYTVLVTAQLLPSGRRRLVDVQAGRWDAGEILDRIHVVQTRYGSTVGVESNGGQNLLIDIGIRDRAMVLAPHHTGMNKHDIVNGIEGLSRELAQGLWEFPCPDAPTLDFDHGLIEADDELDLSGDYISIGGQPHEDVQELINEAIVYDPAQIGKHTGDRLMAWWICREMIRRSAVAGMFGLEVADPFGLGADSILIR
jgi:hypothetical protein